MTLTRVQTFIFFFITLFHPSVILNFLIVLLFHLVTHAERACNMSYEETPSGFLAKHGLKSRMILPKAPFTRERNRSVPFFSVPKSVTLRGCVHTGTLQMTSFLSKRWNDKISDTKSGTVRNRSVQFPYGTIRVLPLAHASVLLFWEARGDDKKQSKDTGGFQKHYWASWSFTCCTHGITEAQHGDHFFYKACI